MDKNSNLPLSEAKKSFIALYYKYILFIVFSLVYLYLINVLRNTLDYTIALIIIFLLCYLFTRSNWRISKAAKILSQIGIILTVIGIIFGIFTFLGDRSSRNSNADIGAIIGLVISFPIAVICFSLGSLFILYCKNTELKIIPILQKIIIVIVGVAVIYTIYQAGSQIKINFENITTNNKISQQQAIDIATQAMADKENLKLDKADQTKESIEIDPRVVLKTGSITKVDDIVKDVYIWNVKFSYSQTDPLYANTPYMDTEETCYVTVKVGQLDGEIYKTEGMCDDTTGFDYQSVLSKIFNKFQSKNNFQITKIEINNASIEEHAGGGIVKIWQVEGKYNNTCTITFEARDWEDDMISNIKDSCK